MSRPFGVSDAEWADFEGALRELRAMADALAQRVSPDQPVMPIEQALSFISVFEWRVEVMRQSLVGEREV